jgi:hypothetical protein
MLQRENIVKNSLCRKNTDYHFVHFFRPEQVEIIREEPRHIGLLLNNLVKVFFLSVFQPKFPEFGSALI